ncbi:hypothetical protein [Paraburkholderia sp. BL25I1N1]|uniref:hypothetical protein n=1 Tax=Paraburkholderia sp. BL25I1N1 TaxID=1938804 RepID=UPI000D0791F2|nr:hypothetical protein [Paraburkholderia sp. BL25I1N1]PRY05926.1 hypothetical protein B0G73_108178 [Paraburkholderia sp. BL25I1N1]TCF98353.1 hypothetical protein BZM26_25870 [Paraburkholderia strydomiana]
MRAIALKIEIYDGEYRGDMSALTLTATLSGTIEGLAPNDFLRAIVVLLEMSQKRYATPSPVGPALTVFVRRKAPALLARIDISLRGGIAKANLSCDGMLGIKADVAVAEGDDVVSIARSVLDALCDECQLSALAESRLKSVSRSVQINLDDL